jgi:hypothetical protein
MDHTTATVNTPSHCRSTIKLSHVQIVHCFISVSTVYTGLHPSAKTTVTHSVHQICTTALSKNKYAIVQFKQGEQLLLGYTKARPQAPTRYNNLGSKTRLAKRKTNIAYMYNFKLLPT